MIQLITAIFYLSSLHRKNRNMMKFLNLKLATCFKKKSKRSQKGSPSQQKSGTVLTQTKKTRVIKNWVLLDSQSTIDVSCKPSLLTNIRTSPGKLQILCNASTSFTNQAGDLEGYRDTVWFYPEGIANTLSLHCVTEIFHVTYGSRIDDQFVVWKESGRSCRFIPGPVACTIVI